MLIGASHGGWAIMDLLALDPPRRLPFNLAALPADAPADPLAGVAGTILLYPYCGRGQPRPAPTAGRRPIPTLFLLSADDVDRARPALHRRSPSGMQARGAAGRDRELFDGVTHGFDQQDRVGLQPPRLRRRGDRTGARGDGRIPRRPAAVTQNGQITGTSPTATTKNQSIIGSPNFQ